MNIKQTAVYIFSILITASSYAQAPATPDKIYGQLFKDVQLQGIFPDSKTFVDCTPKRNIKDIMYDYGMMKGPGFNLKKFVEDNFELPPAPPQLNYIQQEKNISLHIKNLWGVLKRKSDLSSAVNHFKGGNSLLPLPASYIVPGGRFREVYYWDSYFTMLGLKESGETDMIENMVKNFAYQVNSYGHIPNGNRSYYISRSNPPFFSLMVELLTTIKGNTILKTYLPAMEKEYAYWMEGSDVIKSGSAFKHLVKLADGTLLNRYWDAGTGPRAESYKEDHELAETVANELAMRIKVSSPEALKKILDDKKAEVALHLRSAVESGWDFSSRWFADEKNLATIQTAGIIPVDLNCLLYMLEMNISKAKKMTGLTSSSAAYLQKANKRKAAVLKYCWNSKEKFFYDYDAVSQVQRTEITAAGLFPLYAKMATTSQAADAEATTIKYLLKPGGIITTNEHTGQQWDAPNGWAPLQWISVTGFNNYRKNETAKQIAKRWLSLNEKVYAATGKLMEKYNVEDISKEAGGGQYPAQDGYGWTNGVYLALKKMFPSNK